MTERPSSNEFRDSTERIILIVDDEPSLLVLTSLMCERVGYGAATVASSRAAVQEFKKDPERCLVVILDGTLEGVEDAFATMRSIRPRLPVIIASGYAGAITCGRFLKGETPTVLAKPFSQRELLHAVETALATDQAETPDESVGTPLS